MSKAYLSIDDSPTQYTDQLTDWLKQNDIPAILFVRGERMEDNFQPIVNAIRKGFVIGNHLYSHRRSSQLSYEEVIEEIEKTESLIDRAYKKARIERTEKYIRFPHMDRGTGGWVVDYDRISDEYRPVVEQLFLEGLCVNNDKPSPDQLRLKEQLGTWLSDNDYATPYPDIGFPWYRDTEIGQAIDAMYTFSTADWMLTKRHKGKHIYKTINDLKLKIDNDVLLMDTSSPHIILMHDDPEDILEVTKQLVSYMKEKKRMEFI